MVILEMYQNLKIGINGRGLMAEIYLRKRNSIYMSDINERYVDFKRSIYSIMLKYSDLLSDDIAIAFLKLQVKLLKKSAKNGDKVAQFELAMMYADSGYFPNNPLHNYKLYVYWLQKSAKNNNVAAKANLSLEYLYSNDIRYINIIEGLSLLKDSYLAGYETAIINYNVTLDNLKNRKSKLRKNFIESLQSLSDSGKEFLSKHPDYSNAIGYDVE